MGYCLRAEFLLPCFQVGLMRGTVGLVRVRVRVRIRVRVRARIVFKYARGCPVVHGGPTRWLNCVTYPLCRRARQV